MSVWPGSIRRRSTFAAADLTPGMFGTDGVRGTPGVPPLDPPTVSRLGAATVKALGVAGGCLLVARDTRESGPVLEYQLAGGVQSAGGRLVSVGVLPTPAAAWLTATNAFDGAFVISASHNPYPDNGIKVLTADGEKASADLESAVAAIVADASWEPAVPSSPVVERQDLGPAYERFVASTFGGDRAWAAGCRIAVDCANGATSDGAPRVLHELGFEVIVGHDHPDGRNINDGCGSTHPESLVRMVHGSECRLGVAFDGDGDRAILVDGTGAVVDGDAMLFICASHWQAEGRLPGGGIVATVMSNIGLEIALRHRGVSLHRCPVGDRSVREAMRRHGVAMGGEQSGHLIFSDYLPTGDGLLTTLMVLRVMRETGRELAELRQGFEVYPQLLLNVPVRTTPELGTQPSIVEAIEAAERTLGSTGRVVVRYSGTEPILRVMIEGRDRDVVRRLAGSIADRASECLG